MTASSHAVLGTIPDWIAAIGTTLAFFVAFSVLLLDRGERHRRQASQVAAWFERGESVTVLHIANSSEVPIYDVQITPRLLGQTYDVIQYPLISPKADLVPLKIPLPGNKQVSNKYLGVQVLFTDSSGRRWRRAINGKLRRRLKKLSLTNSNEA